MATKEETETVITWTSADKVAIVYTMHQKIKRQCAIAGGVEILHNEGIRNGKKEAWTFLVPVGLVKIRKTKKVSQAQRDAFRARMSTAVGANEAKND